jgi:hypothetical protein
MVGVDTKTLDRRMSRVMPEDMSMGQTGMGGMGEMEVESPPNSAPMRGGKGPFSYVDMAGMFTVLKIRDRPSPQDDNSWYRHPKGTVAGPANPERMQADGIKVPAQSDHQAPQKIPAAAVRTVLPLSIVTCTSMLAMDLYLPNDRRSSRRTPVPRAWWRRACGQGRA